jgi:flagellar hook protein FlgE
MPSFSTSLSGLDAASQALAVIGNNLANLNTIAFKESTTVFKDLFYQQLGTTGNGSPIQVGVGAGVAAVLTTATQGSVQSTGVPSDVAIQGNGYFVVQGPSGSQEFTRAGDFGQNSSGQLVANDGGLVLGYPAVNGVVDSNQAPGPLTVGSGTISPPNPTANVSLSMNLSATAAVGDTFSQSLPVYDSLGSAHNLTYTFTNVSPGNWSYAITMPSAEVQGGSTTNPATSVATGTLVFDGSGKLTTPSGNVTGIALPTLADGASAQKLTWNLFPNGQQSVTQLAGPSAPISTSQDGFASGSLSSYNVLSDGTIEGTFSNGQSLALGQIALANFSNVQGLQANGAGNYTATLSSGSANIGAPNSAGRGTLAGGSLELSNVDIATEFSNLILAQRGFQANAKAITTLDDVTQTAIDMMR